MSAPPPPPAPHGEGCKCQQCTGVAPGQWAGISPTGVIGVAAIILLFAASLAWFMTLTAVNECKSGLIATLAAQQCSIDEAWHTLADVGGLAGLALAWWAIVRFRRDAP
jgi:hypothetical protein